MASTDDRLHKPGPDAGLATAGACFLALVLLVSPVLAQQAETPAPAAQVLTTPAESQSAPTLSLKASYTGGQLSIEAANSTLEEILSKVSALLNVRIEIPEAARQEKLFVTLGPGPGRRILAELLDESGVDYVIQELDSGKIASVLLLERQKTQASPVPIQAAAIGPRGPHGRAVMSADSGLSPDSDHTASGSPDTAAAEASSPNSLQIPARPEDSGTSGADAPPPPADPSGSSAISPPDSSLATGAQPGMLNGQKVAPMSVPATLNSESISQQLQQMYQQRMQINQQQAAAPASPVK